MKGYICFIIALMILFSALNHSLVPGWSVPINSEGKSLVNGHVTATHGEILPQTIMLDPHWLVKMKQGLIRQNDSNLQDFLKKIVIEADSFLSKRPVSVMEKNQTAPSGDKHDFYSLAAYEWPNPNTPNGLPYVSRDGQVNPEKYTISDKGNLDDMIYRVNRLSAAYYFTEDARYASKAQELLRVWFLNNDTYMNPNLEYAEIEKGKGRLNPSGIMEGVSLPQLTDSIRLLQQSPKWSKELERGMGLWFSKYLDWLLTSDSGRIEGRRMNNHGTYYMMQVASIALYLDRKDITKELLESSMQDISTASFEDVPKLIAVRINPDGTQPFELERTTSLHYSIYNLLGLFQLANIGERIGIDLWNHENHGTGLRKALDYILPYAVNKEPWPYKQIQPTIKNELAKLSCQAMIHYQNNQSYLEAYSSVDVTKLPIDLDYPICNTLAKLGG